MSRQRLIAGAVIATVAAAVAAGLVFTGSPAQQRQLRFDERRVADLNRLNWAITAYSQENRTLPIHLQDLVNGRNLDVLPLDPASGESYEYVAMGPDAFELCAVFSLTSKDVIPSDFWHHDAGRRCFAFDVPEPVDAALPRFQ
jgi:hypothetical protein